ncbi:hypothetical protein ACS0TY_017549 [Phlomoides rotata]
MMTTTLLDTCRVAPPPGAAGEQSLPLTFSDIIWLPFHPIRRLLFYESPNFSKPCFLEILVPKLKQSLSLTLQHFFPLAGNLVYPLSPDKKPVIRYRPGDSVPVTISESTEDFYGLVENQARNADKFYDFIPQMPSTVEEPDQKILPVLALQVTLFPGRGICIGLSNHHSVGDASSIIGFINSWALVNKNGKSDESLPIFDRALVKYPVRLDSIYWNHVRNIPIQSLDFPVPTDRVRATFVFTRSELESLKSVVRARIPGLVHVSSFVVMAACVWSCLAKSLVKESDELGIFLFPVDFRERIDPPVPGNYFGNCLSYGLAKIGRGSVVGDDGFFLAAKAIAEEIGNRATDKGQILDGAERRLEELGSVVRKPFLSVSGSSRVDLYGPDFGWGRVRKVETLSIDGERYAMSLCKCRDVEGGLEVGLSLPKVNMDAFAAYFSEGLKAE